MRLLKNKMEENNTQFPVPILFILFNQPYTTARVFEAIRNIKPAKLYIAADGPRPGKEGEAERCDGARRATEGVDWPCEVKLLFQEKNLGGKKGPITALDWFFENEEEGIILEHDCLPSEDFFRFCEELLNKYRNVDKVKMISGDNFQFGKKFGDASYYFSHFPLIWGWATWKRAWKEYDGDMKSYPDFKKNNRITRIFKDKRIQKYWLKLFDNLYYEKTDVWDGQLAYTIYDHDGIVVMPNVNLISNIGFGEDATHTKNPEDILNNLPRETLETIIHPEAVEVDKLADEYLFQKMFYRSIKRRIIDKIFNFIRN